MCKVICVDGYVNLAPMEEKEFQTFIASNAAKGELDALINLIETDTPAKEIQKQLLALEERVLDTPDAPKDMRLEVLTDEGYVTLGWFDNGVNASVYQRREPFRR